MNERIEQYHGGPDSEIANELGRAILDYLDRNGMQIVRKTN